MQVTHLIELAATSYPDQLQQCAYQPLIGQLGLMYLLRSSLLGRRRTVAPVSPLSLAPVAPAAKFFVTLSSGCTCGTSSTGHTSLPSYHLWQTDDLEPHFRSLSRPTSLNSVSTVIVIDNSLASGDYVLPSLTIVIRLLYLDRAGQAT